MQQTTAPGEFLGRARELAGLEREYEAEASSFVPMSGRRRVAKSELILRSLRARTGISHVGKQAAAGMHLREFLVAASVALGEPLLASLAVDGWKAALEAVVGRFRGPGKLILA